MESVNDIKEALSARSRTATLDELRSEGRRRVRLIRAEHIAAMISEAVNAAVEQSGLVSPQEVERLVEKSRVEFRSILKEREAEVQRAHEVAESLAEREAEVAQLKQQLADASATLAATRRQLGQGAAPGGAPAAASGDLVLSLVQEMANLKANLMQRDSQQQPAAAGAADFSAAIEKLTGSLNERLEKLGKKMGVSAAVESDAPVDFGGLFRDTGKALESNIDNIEVKQKSGGGIAGNLARLKKLKGGG
jgi:DNA repair exonuclease SbcCD ATPase subunit